MARTELDVANEALQALQESPITDLTLAGKANETMKFFLPIARRTSLQMYDWTCARRRAPLTLITEESPGVPVINYTGRLYVYQSPADALRIVDVLNPLVATRADWIKEGNRIYTDAEEAIGVYTIDLPDPADWDDLLATVVAFVLASRAAYTITGIIGRETALLQNVGAYITEAKRQSHSDARQRLPPSDQWAPGLFNTESRR